jgi:isochorismate synthase
VTTAESGIRLTLDAVERDHVARVVHEACESGETRWLARVSEAHDLDALLAFDRSQSRERFYWERVEAGEAIVAWGVCDEIESAGPSRFRDVARWSAGLNARLAWIGAARPGAAPLAIGGFGFDEDGSPCSDWKAFPATRFFLPEVIGERRADGARWVVIARIEPGAGEQAVVEALETRLAAAIEGQTPMDVPDGLLSFPDSPLPELAEGGPGVVGWPPGPEYAVRSDRSHEVFRAQVARALAEIERGALEKVVLARSLSVEHDGQLEVPSFLGRLRSLYPSCTLIALARGDDTFLAATPESLVRVEDGVVETAALAGSAPRGRSPEEDRRFADALLGSDKERAEHAHVVAAIREGLAPFCEELAPAAEPRLRRLFGIQHLETPIRARLSVQSGSQEMGAATGVLDLVEALHPTPAVAGVPRARAREWLERVEGLDRGWYASPIGWIDREGGGDFRVALRSALIRNDSRGVESGQAAAADRRPASHARLFAGAGIVAGSVPEQELVETRIKLRALLAPLTEI